jgi:hypothetical protein
MRSTGMPTSVQLSGFCATARMAFPRYVLVRSKWRIASVASATPKTATRFTETSAPAITAARVE